MGLSIASEKEPDSISKLKTIKNMVSDSLSYERDEVCTTTFHDEMEQIRGMCNHYHNYSTCLNTTGPNTDCTKHQEIRKYPCIVKEQNKRVNATDCEQKEKLNIEVKQKKGLVKKYDLDHSDFGPCKQEKSGDCLIITCVDRYDGAHNGQFVGCRVGQCQRFEICPDVIKTYYKNSGKEFVDFDPTFYGKEMKLVEVPQ